MPTAYTTRPVVNTSYNPRTWPQKDLWYLVTQLWILCNNSWNKIVFHTWIFYDSQTQWATRPII